MRFEATFSVLLIPLSFLAVASCSAGRRDHGPVTNDESAGGSAAGGNAGQGGGGGYAPMTGGRDGTADAAPMTDKPDAHDRASDARLADANADASAPSLAACVSPFCETFESFSAGVVPTSKTMKLVNENFGSAATLSVDDTRSYSGTHSAKIVVHGPGVNGRIALNIPASVLASDKRTVHARAMVYFQSIPTIQEPGHWDVIDMFGDVGSSSGTISFGGVANGTSRILYFQPNNGDWTDCEKTSSLRVPTGRWLCYEFAIDASNPNAAYTASIDGVIAPSLTTGTSGSCDRSWPVPTISSIDFGWRMIHDQDTDTVLWMDDLAVDNKPIGCPAQ